VTSIGPDSNLNIRLSQVQFVRAFAITSVIFYHFNIIPSGFIGVDMFFVVSGFVVTRSLDAHKNLPARKFLAKFYYRRLRRLFPLIFATVLIVFVGSYIFMPRATFSSIATDGRYALFSLENWHLVVQNAAYQHSSSGYQPFLHFWSLAIEEQFYICWPIVLIFVLRRSNRVRGGIFALGLISSFFTAVYLSKSHELINFYLLPTRGWELLLGAIAYYLQPNILKLGANGLTKALSIGSLVAVIGSIFFAFDVSNWPNTSSLIPTIFTALFLLTAYGLPNWVYTLLSHKTIQYLGDLSFALYLVHWPVELFVNQIFLKNGAFLRIIISLVVTAMVSILLNRYIEVPFRFSPMRRRTIILGSAGMCVALAAVSLWGSKLDPLVHLDFPGSTQKIARVSELRTGPGLTGILQCQADTKEIQNGKCEFGSLSSSRTAVLYGDSHASMWFAAINAAAKDEKVKLTVLTKSGCAPFSVKVDVKTDSRASKSCLQWRRNSLERISKIHPSILILGMYESTVGMKSSTLWRTQISDGLSRFKKSLNSPNTKIIYIEDTPHPVMDIPNCLTSFGHQRSCNQFIVPLSITVPKGIDIQIYDPIDLLCESGCHYYYKGLVAYRDDSHLTPKVVQLFINSWKPYLSLR